MTQWDILPSQRDRVWFVGDSKDDMLCGEYSVITPYTPHDYCPDYLPLHYYYF